MASDKKKNVNTHDYMQNACPEVLKATLCSAAEQMLFYPSLNREAFCSLSRGKNPLSADNMFFLPAVCSNASPFIMHAWNPIASTFRLKNSTKAE